MSVRAFCRPFSLAGKLGHAGQHQDDACGQHDEGREMGDHGFVLNQTKAMRVVMRSGKRPRLLFSANVLRFHAKRQRATVAI
jgi:hypothetical protein